MRVCVTCHSQILKREKFTMAGGRTRHIHCPSSGTKVIEFPEPATTSIPMPYRAYDWVNRISFAPDPAEAVQ